MTDNQRFGKEMTRLTNEVAKELTVKLDEAHDTLVDDIAMTMEDIFGCANQAEYQRIVKKSKAFATLVIRGALSKVKLK